MAEFGSAGAGLRDEDPPAPNYGKKLLKALGAAGALKGGKHKEKLRREKQRRRDAEARAEAERRTAMAARRAELHQRAVAEAAERRRQADSKSRAEARARVARATEALEAERAAAWARASETERRCHATERALDGQREAAQRKEQALREQVRTKEWDLEEAERERARWYEEAGQARSTAEAQRSRAEFYVTEAQRRDAAAAVASRHDDAHIDAARAEAAAQTAAAYASRSQAERERARAFTASVEMHQTRDRLIDSKNHELRQQAERSNAYREEATRARDQKRALHERSRRTEAEVNRLKEELEQARSTAAPVGDEGELAADLDKLDRAASSLLANKNELKHVARGILSREPINNHGMWVGPIMSRIDAVEKDFEAMRKLIQEFRARAYTTEARRPSAEETQRLQLQAAAWRNVVAAQEEMQIASDALAGAAQAGRFSWDIQDAAHKRRVDATANWAAARAAAEASSQQGDGDPDIYARLQSQHEEYNRDVARRPSFKQSNRFRRR
jgi:hypothetical protein